MLFLIDHNNPSIKNKISPALQRGIICSCFGSSRAESTPVGYLFTGFTSHGDELHGSHTNKHHAYPVGNCVDSSIDSLGHDKFECTFARGTHGVLYQRLGL